MAKKPEIPEQVFGVPTKPLLDLEQSIGRLGMAAGKILVDYRITSRIEPGLRVFPLVERIQQGEYMWPEDVEPYVPTIKRLVGGKLIAANRAVSALYIVGLGVPLKRAIDRRVEEQFVSRIPDALEQAETQANAYLPTVQPYVEFLAEFDNPREEFVREIDIIATAIRKTTLERANSKGRTEVTSSDAGYAIRQELGRLIVGGSEIEQDLPMFAELVIKRLGSAVTLPEAKIFGVVAPEIMAILDDPLPKDQKDRAFIASLVRNPHSLRGAAKFFKGSRLRFLDSSAPLLSSVRDLLPTKGDEVTKTFQKIKDFVNTKKVDH